MTLDTVVVEIRTGKAVFLGLLSGFCAAWFLQSSVTLFLADGAERQPLILSLFVFCFTAAAAAHYLGVAVRKPVALRMDVHGISGYYAEPATWPEIMSIDAFKGTKGRKYLGFAFLNPDTIRKRQSALSKLLNWSKNPSYTYQIVVPEEILRDADVEGLAARARAFQRAA